MTMIHPSLTLLPLEIPPKAPDLRASSNRRRRSSGRSGHLGTASLSSKRHLARSTQALRFRSTHLAGSHRLPRTRKALAASRLHSQQVPKLRCSMERSPKASSHRSRCQPCSTGKSRIPQPKKTAPPLRNRSRPPNRSSRQNRRSTSLPPRSANPCGSQRANWLI